MPAGAVAFLASLQVVYVPLLLTAMGGAFAPRLALAAGLCVSGVGLLEVGGDALETIPLSASICALLQPIGFGTSYLRIEVSPQPASLELPRRAASSCLAPSSRLPSARLVSQALMKRFPENGLQVSSLQLISNAAIALAWCATEATGLIGTSDTAAFDLGALREPAVLGGVLYTGLVSTALTVLLQTRALSKLPATDSSVIVATEPLWAAGFAFVLLGEVLEPSAQIGGALILGGCLANAVLPEDLGLGQEQDAQ